jgi:hypothetical protein
MIAHPLSRKFTKNRQPVGRIQTYAPNGNNSLAPPKRGEGWGEGV